MKECEFTYIKKQRFDRYSSRGTLNLRQWFVAGKNTSGHRTRPFRSRCLKFLIAGGDYSREGDKSRDGYYSRKYGNVTLHYISITLKLSFLPMPSLFAVIGFL